MSFLEKLKKGMPARPLDPSDAGDNMPNQGYGGQAPEGVATFAFARKRQTMQDTGKIKDYAAEEKPKPKKAGMIRSLTEIEDTVDDAQDENTEPETEQEQELEVPKPKSIKKVPAAPIKKTAENAKTDEWLNNEGQLAVNVYQTETDLVLQAAIAGIKVEDLDVLIEDDVITIKGVRNNPLSERGDYFIEECYWGPFSRKVILPVDVDASRADAAMKEGILTIRIPKIQREKKKKVTIKG